jgi:hypothetical protein
MKEEADKFFRVFDFSEFFYFSRSLMFKFLALAIFLLFLFLDGPKGFTPLLTYPLFGLLLVWLADVFYMLPSTTEFIFKTAGWFALLFPFFLLLD